VNLLRNVKFVVAVCRFKTNMSGLTISMNNIRRIANGLVISYHVFIDVKYVEISSWMQMDKKPILRELKRLELQVASLSGKIPL